MMHMHTYLHTLTSIFILGVIILLVVLLKKRGILKKEQGRLFSGLVTQVTLPALIFDSLANATLEWKYLFLFLMMSLTEIILLFFAWLAGKMLTLSPAKMGAFLLVSTFGSSALIGYALVAELFPGNASALAEATLVSELGVGLPLFTIGVMIAMHYGSQQQAKGRSLDGALHFFRSPMFLAIVLGIFWSSFSIGTTGTWLTPLFEATHIVAAANTFLVALTVGVVLNFSSIQHILPVALLTIVFKLLVSPLIVYMPARFIALEPWQMQVLLLEAAMPSAMLSVALSKQYGCDAELAAKLIFITLVGSLFTTAIMMNL